MEGTATGKFIYTSIAGSILDISKIEISAFNVNGALTSIGSITSAAQAALAALQAIGAQSTVITTPSTVTDTTAIPKTPELTPALPTNYTSDGDNYIGGLSIAHNTDVGGFLEKPYGTVDYDTFYTEYAYRIALDSAITDALTYGYSMPNYQKFAKGGTFTNGIVSKPTAFNMGLMGEAGSEGVLPLHEINGSLGVKAVFPQQSANDSNVDTAELVAELKESNRQLQEQNRQLAALIALNQATLKENQSQTAASQTTAAKIRIGARS